MIYFINVKRISDSYIKFAYKDEKYYIAGVIKKAILIKNITKKKKI